MESRPAVSRLRRDRTRRRSRARALSDTPKLAVDATVTFEDVVAAARRLRGVAHRTPVVTSRTLDERTGATVFLKCENLQRMGAFKFRGAYNRIAQLDAGERGRGVVAYSSGNHAQGIALAAGLLGVPASLGMTIVAGQGTVALELLEEIPDLDALLVCTGGGGLLAGCALVAAELRPSIAVYGVEPETGDDFARSLARGERVEIEIPETIADGQRTTSPGELTFPIVARLGAGIVTVTDDDLRAAMRFAFERLKLVVEPSGAAALAAVMHGKLACAGRRIGVVISGGNVDAADYAEMLAATS